MVKRDSEVQKGIFSNVDPPSCNRPRGFILAGNKIWPRCMHTVTYCFSLVKCSSCEDVFDVSVMFIVLCTVLCKTRPQVSRISPLV